MIEVEPQPRIDTLVRLPGGGGAQDRVHRHGLVRRQTPGAIVDAAATFTDDPSGTPTWIQMHVNGHLGWPAGVGYRVVALTPPDAVR